MATFTLNSNSNWHDATIGGTATSTRAGGDTYVIQNNYTLTVDCDTRYGPNTTTTTGPFSVVTINASTGGTLFIDATNVWLIPFTGGSGNVPTAGTTITQSGQSGSSSLIGVWSAINAAPTASGAAMPASGFIKVRQLSGSYTTAALTGITATVSGALTQGWIEVVMDGVAASVLTIGRTGTFKTRGAWFELGTTNGSRGQTMNLPTSGGTTFYVPGVWIETAVGSNTYDYWPCLTSATGGGWANTTQGTDVRNPFVQCTGSLIRIGSDGTNNIGLLPETGRKVRIPNIFLTECTTAQRGTTAVPNVVLATRPEFATTGGAVIDMQITSCNWYLNLVQAFSFNLVNVAVADSILIQECGSPVNWNGGGVGVCTILTTGTFAMVMTSNLAGGTIQNCKFIRGGTVAGSAHGTSISSSLGLTFTNCFFGLAILRSNNTVAYGFYSTLSNNVTLTSCTSNSGGFQLVTCANWTITNSIVYDRGVSTTLTTYPAYCFTMTAKCADITINGLSTNGVANVQPYNALIYAAGCDRIKVRNIGAPASVMALGGTNPSRYIFALAGNNYDIRLQRIYTSGAATASGTYLNSDKKILLESVWGDTGDKIIGSGTVDAPLDGIWKGCQGDSGTLQASFTAVYGSIFYDLFTSTTAGKIGVIMNEPTASYAAYCTTTGTGKFTSAGNLYLPTVGDTAEWTWPHTILGHTRIANAAVVCTGGSTVSTRMKFNYAIDTGSGFGAWSADYTNLTTLGTDLYNLGTFTTVKLKLRITCTSTDLTNNTINTFYLTTVTDATSRQAQYPLDTLTLTLNGLVAGSDIVILAAGTTTERVNVDANPGTSYAYSYEASEAVDICIYKAGYIPFTIRNYTLATSDASLPIAQVADRNYNNP